jgi:hypothetical protein
MEARVTRSPSYLVFPLHSRKLARASSSQSRNRALSYAVAAREFGKRIALVSALDRFAPLLRGELRLSAEL